MSKLIILDRGGVQSSRGGFPKNPPKKIKSSKSFKLRFKTRTRIKNTTTIYITKVKNG